MYIHTKCNNLAYLLDCFPPTITTVSLSVLFPISFLLHFFHCLNISQSQTRDKYVLHPPKIHWKCYYGRDHILIIHQQEAFQVATDGRHFLSEIKHYNEHKLIHYMRIFYRYFQFSFNQSINLKSYRKYSYSALT